MSGFLPRLFGKSRNEGGSKKKQRIAELESELQTYKAKVEELQGKIQAMAVVIYKKDEALEDITKDRDQLAQTSKAKVEELQGKLEALKVVLCKKDAALNDITTDREKIALELENEYLHKKDVKEQLEERLKNLERDTRRLQIEKSNFKTKKDLILGQITVEDPEQNPHSLEGCSKEIAQLQKYIQSLKATLLEREKTIASLCEKFIFLKRKSAASVAQHKSLKDEFEEISGDLLKKVEDARNVINMLADIKYQDIDPMDTRNFALIQMVQKNGELSLENSTLKLERSNLRQSLTSLELEKNSLNDVNTRTSEMRSVPSRPFTSDSSERSHTLSSPSKVTNGNIPSTSELHPSANDSNVSVKVEKVSRRERPRTRKVERLCNKLQVLHVSDETPNVKITEQVKQVRPHIICCIVRGLTFTPESFKKFIQLQTKLHDTICEKRNAATIATHDLDSLSPGDLTYTARPPGAILVRPLNRDKEFSGQALFNKLQRKAEELRKEKKRNVYSGKHRYLYLLEGKPVYPCLLDSSNKVISFPPITNSDITKISVDTHSLFIEVTGVASQTVCRKVLDTLLRDMVCLGLSNSDTGFHQLTVEQVKIVDLEGNLKAVYPSRADLVYEEESIVVMRE